MPTTGVSAKIVSRPQMTGEMGDAAHSPALLDQPQTTENVDKIRDILFGSQMREYEKRFSRLEERLLKECADVRSEGQKRLDATEAFIKQEIESLSERLNRERTERTDAAEAMTQRGSELAKEIERKFRNLEELDSKGQRDLRQQVLEQGKLLTEEIKKKCEEIALVCDRRLQELHGEKVDRSALASLLNETALRLTGDFRVPGAE